jgi:hypothetical protein
LEYETLKFTVNHSRALMGNDISVSVDVDEGKSIQRVETKLDGFTLADDLLETPSDSYQRTFLSAGDAGHGTEHRLVVSVEQDGGNIHSSTSVWADPI